MLDRVSFVGNISTWGGGLCQAGGEAVLTENTKFTGNTANKNCGQAITKSEGTTLTIKNTITGMQKILDSTMNLYLNEIESLFSGI